MIQKKTKQRLVCFHDIFLLLHLFLFSYVLFFVHSFLCKKKSSNKKLLFLFSILTKYTHLLCKNICIHCCCLPILNKILEQESFSSMANCAFPSFLLDFSLSLQTGMTERAEWRSFKIWISYSEVIGRVDRKSVTDGAFLHVRRCLKDSASKNISLRSVTDAKFHPDLYIDCKMLQKRTCHAYENLLKIGPKTKCFD